MSRNTNRWKTRKLTLCALLTALMLVLGYIENLLPSFGIPGIRIGLSNSLLLFAVYMLDIPTAFILMILKVTLSGLLFSGIPAMMYGFAGGFFSLTLMSILSRKQSFSPVIVSMVGGAAHNTAQVALAMLILNTPQLVYYLGILLLVGLACGALTGYCSVRVMSYIKRSGTFR